jgi:hypothetical protein
MSTDSDIFDLCSSLLEGRKIASQWRLSKEQRWSRVSVGGRLLAFISPDVCGTTLWRGRVILEHSDSEYLQWIINTAEMLPLEDAKSLCDQWLINNGYTLLS